MATGGEGSCLLTSVLHHNGKPFNVFLTPKTFCWCPEESDEHPFSKLFYVNSYVNVRKKL
jgi:hypothetical protein